jgi:hypothetical protein
MLSLPDLGHTAGLGVARSPDLQLEFLMTPKPVTIGSALSEPALSPRQPGSTAFAARFQLEQSHWKAVLDHVDEPQTAALIVDLFDRHPHLQAVHPAVYLRALRRVQQVQKTQRLWRPVACTCRWTGKALIRVGLGSISLARQGYRSWRARRVGQSQKVLANSTTELVWPILIVQES